MTNSADEGQRTRQAWLTNMREELISPVSAILSYGEFLKQESARLSLDGIVPDLERIMTSANDLMGLVDRLLDADHAVRLFEGKDTEVVEKELRHDLRTPINGIKGYGEMLLEDLEDLGAEILRPDLTKLLNEASNLLSQLDGIVDFSRTSKEFASPGSDADTTMIAELVQSVRTLDEQELRPQEIGRILVVDDNQTNRDLLLRRLTRDGHQVSEAEGGKKALALLEAVDFDLVLLDLMMPEMNGFEVLSRIKTDERLRDVPVIMISALDEIDSVIRCIESGAEDYLPKPFNPVLLKARINASLEKKRWRDREKVYLRRLEAETRKTERLLRNILPQPIITRLNKGETLIADRFDSVSVLFSDLVSFTAISSSVSPRVLVECLNRLYTEFDALARQLEVEKIKMIGDAYMVVAGLPEPRADHAQAVAHMALGMMDVVESMAARSTPSFKARIGVHSGPVVAGIIGDHRFVYDVWGDTVNVASRLESLSLPNRIQISEATAELLGEDFEIAPRRSITVKGKGKLRTFFLTGCSRQVET